MSFPRHQEIYPSDALAPTSGNGGASPAAHASAHRADEFPTGYSSAGCSPAEPASASPAGHQYAVIPPGRSRTFHRTVNCALTVCVRPGGKRKLYDQSGKLIVEKDTPMLPAGISGDVFLGNGQFANQVIPGAVFPAVFKDFFALTRAQLSTEAAEAALRSGTIDGTLVFRSSAGQPIAPLVVRTVGASVTLLLQTPLP